MHRRFAAILVVLGLSFVGCQKAEPVQTFSAPGINVQSGPGGTKISMPGMEVQTDASGSNVTAPGLKIQSR